MGKSGSLDCLRKLPREELDHALNITKVGPFPPVIDGNIIQDYPTNQITNGKFAQVPLLIGANTDEGSDMNDGLLSDGRLVNTDADMREALAAAISSQKTGKSSDEVVDEIMYLYPNIQSVGIPSVERWSHIIQPGDSYAEKMGAQYRRTAAFCGDLKMQWARRRANIAWHKHGLPTWAYRFDVVPNGIDRFVGASHFKEVRVIPGKEKVILTGITNI